MAVYCQLEHLDKASVKFVFVTMFFTGNIGISFTASLWVISLATLFQFRKHTIEHIWYWNNIKVYIYDFSNNTWKYINLLQRILKSRATIPCGIVIPHWPLTRYVNLRVAHAPRMRGTFSPPPRISDPDMHHGACVTHEPWCMPGSVTGGFLWNWWQGKCCRHSQHMR